MKSPRDILLNHHHQAEARLDAIREAAVASLRSPHKAARQNRATAILAWIFRGPNLIWAELVLPSRRVWSGLAAVWLLILLIHVALRDPVSSVTGRRVYSEPVMMSWQAQQQWMNELFADRTVNMEPARPQPAAPRPQTETWRPSSV